ncbi:hypothetical protein D3C80_2041990 [compost metagenome]
MLCIKQPFKVNGQHLADRPVHQQLADFGVMRGIAVVEGYAQPFAGPLNSVQDFLAFFHIRSHRLLGYHITA